MHIKNFQHPNLLIDQFQTKPKESWCFYGTNDSGIDLLPNLLSGKIQNYTADVLQLPDKLGLLSFQTQQEIFEEELRNDDSDFLDKIDPGTPVRDFLPGYKTQLPLLQGFSMDHCLDQGFRQLSSGQSRKLLFLRELMRGTTTLLIQNPYDGLDSKSCQELDKVLLNLPGKNIVILLLVNTISDIPDWCSHLALINDGKLTHAGLQEQVRPQLLNDVQSDTINHTAIPLTYLKKARSEQSQKEELVFLQDGFGGYDDEKLFTGLNLSIFSGDHTLITGPNGCGKSTLLDIITGDNSKCYTNNLRIFGTKRGSGESIWELKSHMGIVSPSLHREHGIPGSALHVILSGLFDSIGLYQKVHEPETGTALNWLAWLNLKKKANTPFKRLTFAEQRLVLLGRALIKSPRLLILDEATQGLDDIHRNNFLCLLEKIADQRLSTILFVSHREDEHRSFFKNQIHLDSYGP